MTSTRLYRWFEAGAYIPIIGDENTHAQSGSPIFGGQKTTFTALALSSRKTSRLTSTRNSGPPMPLSITISLAAYRPASMREWRTPGPSTERIIMISRWISSTQETQRRTDHSLGTGISNEHQDLSYGVYGEYDRRNDDQGLTKGFYLYGRFDRPTD